MKFMRASFFVFLLLVFVLAGCADTPPRIKTATLGTVVEVGAIQNPKTTFAPTERIIHLVVQVENVTQGVRVGAKWYAVENATRLLLESDLMLDAFNPSADFALTSANDWIPGNYQVVVYLNGDQERTIDFVVK